MMGLVKKDLLIVVRNLRSLIIMIVGFSFLTLYGEMDFSFFSVYLGVAVMISTFSYDEFNKSDAFIVALPHGKKNAVKAKYVATLIVETIAIVFSFLLLVLGGVLRDNLNVLSLIELSFCTLLGVLFVQSIIYPLIYKFGMEKGRLGIFVSVVGIAILGNIIINYSGFELQIASNVIDALKTVIDYLFPFAVIVIFILSYNLSKRIYGKKEF